MEFSIDRAELLHGLSLSQGVVERRNTLPILANVLIEAEGSMVRIAATDLEVHMKRRCTAKLRKAGAATVAARKLFEFVRELPPGDVAVKLLESQAVEIVSGRSRVKLVGLPAADFPAFPEPGEVSAAMTQPSAELARAIDRTLFAVSSDETRVNLSGVYVTTEKSLLRMVGTDGHRLAMVEQSVKGSIPAVPGVILPRKGVTELRRLLDEDVSEVQLSFSPQVVRVECGEVELTMRLIDGEFPNYEQVISKSTKHKLLLAKTELLAALKRVSVVASDRARGVKFHLSEGQLVVSASSADFGEAREEIEVAYSGEEFAVGFNARYLTDVLAVLPDDQRVEIGLSDDVSPGVVRAEDDEGYSYVVMPMRL